MKLKNTLRDKIKNNNTISFVKVMAIVFIILMVISDWLTMQDLFTSIGTPAQSIINRIFGIESTGDFDISAVLLSPMSVYSFVFALLLEGIPTFGGFAVSALTDVTIYEENRKKIAWGVIICSIVGFLLTFSVIFSARGLLIHNSGGTRAFFEEGLYGADIGELVDELSDVDRAELDSLLSKTKTENRTLAIRDFISAKVEMGSIEYSKMRNSVFIKDVVLMILPLMTSILAFIASYYALGSQFSDILRKKVRKLYKKYIKLEGEFLDIKYKHDDARKTLWESISEKEPMPRHLDTFRKCCYEKIKSKLKINSKDQFKTHINFYNAHMENVLAEFISVLSKHTTAIPRNIVNLDIADLIKEYDEDIKEDCYTENGKGSSINCWSYEFSGEALEKALEETIDNAVIVAQYKTTEKIYKEGDIEI